MSQRRAIVAIAAIAATTMLGACGFDSPAVTSKEHSSIQGSDFSVGPIDVRDAFIASESTAHGPRGYLVVTFVNDGSTADTLTGITSTSGAIALSGDGVSGGSLTIPPRGAPVSIQTPFAAPGGPSAELAASTPPAAGTYVPMQFSFKTAGRSITKQIPVVPGTETTAVSSPIPAGTATPLPPDAPNAND